MRARAGLWSLGLIRDRHVRRILELSGWQTCIGSGGGDLDAVAVWGAKPVAQRGVRAAKRRGLPLVTIEDALLRSVRTVGEPPLGLIIDPVGFYLDTARPSRISTLIEAGLTQAQNARARKTLSALRHSKLSKYNDWAGAERSEPGYVLVVDQVPGDASIALGGASAERFQEMLNAAITENPGAQILLRRHPKAATDPRLTHFPHLPSRVGLLPEGLDPWSAVEGASKVYAVTSQLGYEAVLTGMPTTLFAAPFYGGWGLTEDRYGAGRGQSSLETLIHATHIAGPVWYDPFADDLCEIERAIEILSDRRRAHEKLRGPNLALAVSNWKRPALRKFLSPVRFGETVDDARGDERVITWASKGKARGGWSLEDGFLRSAGLGAALTPPLSLALDESGIYYDPSRPSDLERHICASRNLPEEALNRAQILRGRIVELGLAKYNLTGSPPSERADILVAGQVSDDAALRLGAVDVQTNEQLLAAARCANPDARIAWKPHPDAVAGLREGLVAGWRDYADMIWDEVPAPAALANAGSLWTISSLMGFEALLRGVPVTCLGQPFYAGWGLAQDLGSAPQRRSHGVSLDGLVHAALIDYPVYRDPQTGLLCGPEDILKHLSARPAPVWRSKLLARFGATPFWR